MDYQHNTLYAVINRWMATRVRMTHDFARRRIEQHATTLSFLKALIMNPRATGAILPSSKRLARAMVSHIDFIENSLVVELGAGTGVITQAMLDRGIPPQQIIAIECAPHLAKKLRLRFPDITVVEGNAAHLTGLLKDRMQPISTVISGLPLRSLPATVKEMILVAIPDVLSVKGRYIQFTYDIRKGEDFYPSHYKLAESDIVWRNIPPAKVDVYTCH